MGRGISLMVLAYLVENAYGSVHALETSDSVPVFHRLAYPVNYVVCIVHSLIL